MFCKIKMIAALLGVVLAACQPTPTVLPLPAPTALRIQITPTLGTLAPILNDCARRQTNLGVVLDERPTSSFDPQYLGVSLTWGPPLSGQSVAYRLGEVRLTVVVHPNSPLKKITRAQLQSIYSGSAQKWNAFLQPTCKECSPDTQENPLSEKEIHTWAYNSGDDIQNIFQTAVLGESIPNGLPFLAPSPLAMRTAIAADPSAIGFLPEREVDASVKVLTLPDISADTLRQPVIASMPAIPQAETQGFLTCLVEKLK